MRVLAALRRPSLVRYYESTFALLAERGHEVEIVFSELVGKGDAPPDTERADVLRERFPDRVSYCAAPEIDPADGWRGIAGVVRMAGDFARFLHPRFAHAPRLRRRLAERLALLLHLGGGTAVDLLARGHSAALAAAGARLGRLLEEALPPAPAIVALLAQRRPDVVVVSPLIDPGSDQVEVVKAARSLGIPSAAAIASWDNLSSKGQIRLDPDRTFVWNEIQVREAVEMHGVRDGTVVATGAPRFDPWFTREPSRSRAGFTEEIGLDPAAPFVLYLCSSAFIAPNEPPFVERWLARLRADDELGALGVLVRPHPQNAGAWASVDLTQYGNATVWPRGGENVDDEASRSGFYDSLAHCAAVVGANTSALIEAAIVGKPVYTVVDETSGTTQHGTLHYHYLRAGNGGFLHEAASPEEHLVQLRAGVAGAAGEEERTRAFVASFVRPRGLDVPATAILADEIERLAGVTAAPLPRRPVTRALLGAVAAARRLRRAGRAGRSGTVRA